SQGRVTISIGRARDRHRRGKLGVAKCSESAYRARDYHRDHDGRSGIFSRGLARQNKNAGADDRPDAEKRQRGRTQRLSERMLAALFGLSEYLFEWFYSEEFHSAMVSDVAPECP